MTDFVRTCLSTEGGLMLCIYLKTEKAMLVNADNRRAIISRFMVKSVRNLVSDTLIDTHAFLRQDLPRMVVVGDKSVVNPGRVCVRLSNGIEEYAMHGVFLR